MREQHLEPVAHFALIAFAHVLDLLGKMFDVNVREAALSQQLGVAGGPFEKIPIVEGSSFFPGHSHMIVEGSPACSKGRAKI